MTRSIPNARPQTQAHAQGEHDAQSNTNRRILRAAYALFDSDVGSRATMEDIARHAGVSRQTVYRHFPTKEDLLESICCHEALKVNQELRSKLSRSKDFAELLTQTLFLIVRAAAVNPYLNSFLHNTAFHARAGRSEGKVQQLNRELWGRLLERAAAEGKLSAELGLDEVVWWLTLSQAMLQIRMDQEKLDDDALRRLIRLLVVKPLLR